MSAESQTDDKVGKGSPDTAGTMSCIRSNTKSGFWQRRRRSIAPAHRAAGDADGPRRLDVADFVTDRDHISRIDAGTADDAPEFG